MELIVQQSTAEEAVQGLFERDRPIKDVEDAVRRLTREKSRSSAMTPGKPNAPSRSNSVLTSFMPVKCTAPSRSTRVHSGAAESPSTTVNDTFLPASSVSNSPSDAKEIGDCCHVDARWSVSECLLVLGMPPPYGMPHPKGCVVRLDAHRDNVRRHPTLYVLL